MKKKRKNIYINTEKRIKVKKKDTLSINQGRVGG